jgi:hypothetical protein
LGGLQSLVVGGEHGELYKTAVLKQVLRVLLDAETLMGPWATRQRFYCATKLSLPGSYVHAAIDFPRGTVRVTAELRLLTPITSEVALTVELDDQ